MLLGSIFSLYCDHHYSRSSPDVSFVICKLVNGAELDRTFVTVEGVENAASQSPALRIIMRDVLLPILIVICGSESRGQNCREGVLRPQS